MTEQLALKHPALALRRLPPPSHRVRVPAALVALLLAVLAGALSMLPPSATAADQPPVLALVEPPFFEAQVKAGKLPPVADRMPLTPLIVTFEGANRTIGRHGGQITQLMGNARDVRRMSAFGYTRLVTYDHDLKLVPDVLRAFQVENDRVFTFHLRPGHRWSDGKPFTSEDFRFYWEDVASNTELSVAGPDRSMMPGGEKPIFEMPDALTVRYTWSRPNPYFLVALASASPLVIYRPAHVLKRFHPRYTKPDRLNQQVAKANRRDWVDLFYNRDRTHRLDRPGFPTLDPWLNTTEPPADRVVFERNPYYHRVDSQGRQLPYLDQLNISISNAKLIPAKVGAGEVELQSRSLAFGNYTLLKRGEKRSGYEVRLWPSSRGSQVALYPNLNVTDPTWRALVRDVRFRRALSVSIDRREVNQVIYFGLGKEGANTLLTGSPLAKAEYRTAWSQYQPEMANRLLDDLGLTARDGRGVRLLPDGRPLEIIVETAGEETEHVDVLELVRDTWRKVGIALFIKPQTRETLRRRVRSGLTVMSAFYGLDNGIASASFPPSEFVPSNDDQLQWPKYGMHHMTGGMAGDEADMQAIRALNAAYKQWADAADDAGRAAAWTTILDIWAREVFTIGVVNTVPQPVVVSRRLRNVPDKAYYSWDPGAHFGRFRPETFWLEDSGSTN